jgi:acyl carrier protein
MEDSAIRQTLRTYVEDNFLYMRRDLQFSDEDSLLRRGVIDSLGVMELVGFVEETWDLTIRPEDLTETDFGSLAAIAGYVAACRGD